MRDESPAGGVEAVAKGRRCVEAVAGLLPPRAPFGETDADDDQCAGEEVEGLQDLAEDEHGTQGAKQRDEVDEEGGAVGADELDAAHVEHLADERGEKD